MTLKHLLRYAYDSILGIPAVNLNRRLRFVNVGVVQSVVSEKIRKFIENNKFIKINKSWNLDSDDKDYNSKQPYRYNNRLF